MIRLAIHSLLATWIAIRSSLLIADQVSRPRRIGVLLVGWSCEQKEVHGLHQALRDAGYADGRDVVIECAILAAAVTRNLARWSG